MKKVIFCAMALMIWGLTYAQYGPQYVGPTETATLQPALPGAAVTANTGLSIQNGQDHKVRVQQAGTEQSAYSYQDNGSVSGGNLALIQQLGMIVPASGIQNAADVLQSGDINESRTVQRGDYNSAVTKQGQKNDASIGNKGFIEQGMDLHGHAESNIAKLEQDGEYNQGIIYQTYDNNNAWTIQDGERNYSYTRQLNTAHDMMGHYAYTEQIGADNTNKIYQDDDAGEINWAWAYQTGISNKSFQTQLNTGLAGSGFVNYAMVNQGAFQAGIITPTNIIGLILVDNDVMGELASLSSFTSGSLAFQNQAGNDLDAETHQYGTDSYSEQNQAGVGNDAFVIQDSDGNSGNYARQDQFGTNSFADLGQFGSGNKAWQRQLDDNNIIVSTQIGDDNCLNTYQDGDGNRGITTQTGDYNVALLTQRGGHSYNIDQNGTGNQVDILQLGPLGDFTLDYIECSFERPMDPPTMNDIPDLLIEPICNGCTN